MNNWFGFKLPESFKTFGKLYNLGYLPTTTQLKSKRLGKKDLFFEDLKIN